MTDCIDNLKAWRVIQTAANLYLKQGMKKEQEVREQLRSKAKFSRTVKDQKWWTQYSNSREIAREKRTDKLRKVQQSSSLMPQRTITGN